MAKEKPFSATFKLGKETKNTFVMPKRQKGGGRWWARCTSTRRVWRKTAGGDGLCGAENRCSIPLSVFFRTVGF
jgi:hypothetical protein